MDNKELRTHLIRHFNKQLRNQGYFDIAREYKEFLTYAKQLGVTPVWDNVWIYSHIFFKEGIALFRTDYSQGKIFLIPFNKKTTYFSKKDIKTLRKVKEYLYTAKVFNIGTNHSLYHTPKGIHFTGFCSLSICSEDLLGKLYWLFRATNVRSKKEDYELWFPSGLKGLRQRRIFIDKILKDYCHDTNQI